MKFKNPIIPGFYPDPSICRKGKDYYLVTSSFEFFPGVPIFHSTDLVNWTQIGHCLTRESQLDLKNIRYSKGIYAATIRYNPNDELFYMVTTNVTRIGNFYVYAKDPAGEWSEPILVDQGGIDPSLFFDDDGSAHFISNHRDRGVAGIACAGFHMAPIDLKTGKFLESPRPAWGGIGESAPEAPHIYKKDGWYYQLIAEGGTELNHMVTIARSRELYGEYESCPNNPILTHKHMKGHLIQATGHADLIEDHNGNWWAVFLGYRQTHQYFHHLGRETFLAPVTWQDGWPVINNGNPIEEDMNPDIYPDIIQTTTTSFETNFENGIGFEWVHLRNPEEKNYRSSDKGIALIGNACNLSDVANPAFLGFRQRDLDACAMVDLTFNPSVNNEEAGISVFYKYDAHLDICIIRENNENNLCFKKYVGDISVIQTKLPIKSGTVTLKIKSDKLNYYFYAVVDGNEIYLGTALTRYVSTEAHELGFTGTFYALYASGNGRDSTTEALFSNFKYNAI